MRAGMARNRAKYDKKKEDFIQSQDEWSKREADWLDFNDRLEKAMKVVLARRRGDTVMPPSLDVHGLVKEIEDELGLKDITDG